MKVLSSKELDESFVVKELDESFVVKELDESFVAKRDLRKVLSPKEI